MFGGVGFDYLLLLMGLDCCVGGGLGWMASSSWNRLIVLSVELRGRYVICLVSISKVASLQLVEWVSTTVIVFTYAMI